jgi:aminoglycoside 6'-N-acetyltransferase
VSVGADPGRLPDASAPTERSVTSEPPNRPTLTDGTVTLRPGADSDLGSLVGIMSEPSILQWWVDPEPAEEIGGKLVGASYAVLLVIEFDGKVVGGIEFHEEESAQYKHAAIDMYLGTGFQGRGLGTRALRLLTDFLFDVRGHHRVTIDPAAANLRAIRCYEKVGFRPIGLLREYERGPDGTFHDGLFMDYLASDRAGAE